MGNAQGVEGVMLGGGTIGADEGGWGFSLGIDFAGGGGAFAFLANDAGRWSGGLVKRRALTGVRLESLGMVGRAEKLPGVGNIK